MSDSVSVVIGGEAAPGLADLPVVPAAGGQCEDALAHARPDAFGGVAAVTLERELAFEGVVNGLDPLADAAERAEARLLVRRSGRRSCAPSASAMNCSNSAPANPLSVMKISSPCSSSPRAARSSRAAATSRSLSLAGAKQNAIGIPSGAHSR